uniref:DUF4200 domain-containing protein n=1 Tax=Electrophorus electricus TaxID=8005 RepID=A0A4W4GYC1_ELEEL
ETLAPHFHLLQKRREIVEVYNAMKPQREVRQYILVGLSLKTQSKLQLIHDNEVKRRLAVRKARREREMTNQKQPELHTLQEEMKSLVKVRDELARRVKRNDVYHNYLDKVVQASRQFQKASEVMFCFETLWNMRADLLRSTQQKQDSVEQHRARLAGFARQRSDKLLRYNNALAQLHSQLDEARTHCKIWESRWAHIQNTAATKTLLLGTVKIAIFYLYQIVRKRAKDAEETPLAPEDTFKQLDKIWAFLSELIFVWEKVRKSEAVHR